MFAGPKTSRSGFEGVSNINDFLLSLQDTKSGRSAPEQVVLIAQIRQKLINQALGKYNFSSPPTVYKKGYYYVDSISTTHLANGDLIKAYFSIPFDFGEFQSTTSHFKESGIYPFPEYIVPSTLISSGVTPFEKVLLSTRYFSVSTNDKSFRFTSLISPYSISLNCNKFTDVLLAIGLLAQEYRIEAINDLVNKTYFTIDLCEGSKRVCKIYYGKVLVTAFAYIKYPIYKLSLALPTMYEASQKLHNGVKVSYTPLTEHVGVIANFTDTSLKLDDPIGSLLMQTFGRPKKTELTLNRACIQKVTGHSVHTIIHVSITDRYNRPFKESEIERGIIKVIEAADRYGTIGMYAVGCGGR